MKIIMPGLSMRLKELRSARAFTQKEMAEVLECTITHYQRIEYGQINLPALDLITLADFFGVTLDYLVGRSEKGGPGK